MFQLLHDFFFSIKIHHWPALHTGAGWQFNTGGLKGEKRGRAKADHADMSYANTASAHLRLGLIHLIIYNERSNRYGQHGQGEELAEHAGMYRGGLLSQVTSAMMMHALGACRQGGSVWLMDMERRENEHWHKYCQ